MNGTLISHPPGGGGCGSSVTKGGPACAELITSKQAIPIPADQSFMSRWCSSDEINRDSDPLFMCELKDSSFGWIDEVCRFALASDNAACAFHGRDRRFQMKFSMIIYLSNGEARRLRSCGVEQFCVR